MMTCNAVCLAYETITDDNGSLPLLTPMSIVAGRLASQQGAKYLESPQGGLGVLMGGVKGVSPANVMVLGGGVVGTQAALVAAGMGANVTIYDINPNDSKYSMPLCQIILQLACQHPVQLKNIYQKHIWLLELCWFLGQRHQN